MPSFPPSRTWNSSCPRWNLASSPPSPKLAPHLVSPSQLMTPHPPSCEKERYGHLPNSSLLLLSSSSHQSASLVNSVFFFWPWQEAGEVLVPNQALNPHLGQWNHWVLITGLPGNPPILSLFLSFFNNFIYLFLATLGFCCCTGFSLAVECGLLLVVASFVAEHGLQVSRASEVVAIGL